VAILDLQGMENTAPATGNDPPRGSSASASCPKSSVSLTLCHESALSLLLC
jgi:hypothetical protein